MKKNFSHVATGDDLEWDRLRRVFAESPLANEPLAALCERCGEPAWPVDDEDENPAAYLSLSHEELIETFDRRRYPEGPTRLGRILRALQQPAAAPASVNSVEPGALHLTLARLELPREFPLTLSALDATSVEQCHLEGVRTLGHFAELAPDLARRGIGARDFHRLLDALTRADENLIAEFLPYRPGAAGLQLVEALAQAVEGGVSSDRLQQLLAWFRPEVTEWEKAAAHDPRFVARQLSRLGDEGFERRILDCLAPYFAAGRCLPDDGALAKLRRWLNI